MSFLAKAWEWLKKYWYIPVFFLAALAGWILARKNGSPFFETIAEVKGIQAESSAKKLEAMLGTQKAREIVMEQYEAEIKALTVKQTKEASELARDPGALAKFLVKVGKK